MQKTYRESLENGKPEALRRDEKWPDESELTVFRTFVAKLITLQKKLEKKYQGEC